MDNRIRAFISEIIFNNGKQIHINPNSIVLFVGPNNVGKNVIVFLKKVL